jgi:hypothetical protein
VPIAITLKDDTAAVSAVATIWAATGNVLFTAKAYATIATIA